MKKKPKCLTSWICLESMEYKNTSPQGAQDAQEAQWCKHNVLSTWWKVENILKRRSWGFFLTKERYLQRSQSILSSGVVPKKEPGEEANPHSICKAELILGQIKLDYTKLCKNAA